GHCGRGARSRIGSARGPQGSSDSHGKRSAAGRFGGGREGRRYRRHRRVRGVGHAHLRRVPGAAGGEVGVLRGRGRDQVPGLHAAEPDQRALQPDDRSETAGVHPRDEGG
ncbi:unnamed protein product, partial [Ectocarpus sp. 8 AP-2014]